jgi:hypothetical protein
VVAPRPSSSAPSSMEVLWTCYPVIQRSRTPCDPIILLCINSASSNLPFPKCIMLLTPPSSSHFGWYEFALHEFSIAFIRRRIYLPIALVLWMIRSIMRRSSFFCPAIATLIVVASTTASPVSSFGSFPSPHQTDNDRSLKERQLVDCKDIRAAPDSSCWATLGLSQYLNDPNTGWNHTTPICDATMTSGACCIPGEPWTTCYLRLAHNIGGYDCSQINPQSCALNLQQSVDPSIAPQVHYVLKTIYSSYPLFRFISTLAKPY